ncbi:MAG: cytochrome c [Pseudomonadota bacterium]|nr:cytochrome c [Pseudomonadota bacterium]
MNRLLIAATACAFLSGCEAQEQARQAQAPGNQVIASAETRTAGLGKPIDAAKAKQLMHERHERMEEIGDAMKLVSRELKGDGPDLAKVRQGANTIATLAPQVPGWFPPGTGPDVGKTEAKAEIWQKPEDFLAKASAFNRAAMAFQAAARSGDLAAIRAAHGDLGKSCKACHDLYREEH